jgi:DNA repair protein RadA/Sms
VAKDSAFVCQSCGANYPKWAGRCGGCGGWNTLVEERIPKGARSAAGGRGNLAVSGTGGRIVRLDEALTQEAPRVPCGMPEVDRVLGGGFVEGSVVLLGGEPGVGKSTLLLQVVATLATRARTGSAKGGVLYVSGEESAAQVAGRAKRLGVRDGDALHLLASGVLEDVEAAIAQTDASVIAIDSVQTMRAGDLESAAGSVGQLREVTSRLVTLAKQQGRTVVLVGHVTKDGSLAGPKVLEHLVDVVVAFEGSRSGGPRILRAVKNRFGPAGEIAVLEMTRDGLQEVADPSSLFLAERPKDVPGSVVAASADGIRPMLVEVQALVTPSAMPSPRRVATGVDATRLAILVGGAGTTRGAVGARPRRVCERRGRCQRRRARRRPRGGLRHRVERGRAVAAGRPGGVWRNRPRG